MLRSLGDHIRDVRHIYFEYNEKNNGRYGYTGEDLIRFVGEHGFDIFLPEMKDGELSLTLLNPHAAVGRKADLVAVRRHTS